MGDCHSHTLPCVAWGGRWELLLPNQGGWAAGEPQQGLPWAVITEGPS